jgi:hypothetical protein
MGLPFPVYSEADRPPKDDPEARAALKAQILALVQHDPEIKALLDPVLERVRPLLKAKTGGGPPPIEGA